MFTKLTRFILLVLLVQCAVVARADVTVLRLEFSLAVDPVEASVGEPVTVVLNVAVVDGEGNPAALPGASRVSVSLAALTDPETGLSVAGAADTFNFPAGFGGGRRSLISAVGGSTPPAAVLLKPALTFSAEGIEVSGPENTGILVRARQAEDEGGFHFCPQPGRGEAPDTPYIRPFLYNDFSRCLVVGNVSAGGRAAATVLAGINVEVVAIDAQGDEQAQTEITVSDALQKRAIDSDNNGEAESIRLTLHLESTGVSVAVNQKRLFAIRVLHDNGGQIALLGLEKFEVTRREHSWSGSTGYVGVATVGDESPFSASFGRNQSRALSPAARVLRNGVEMNAAARATLTLEPWATNAEPSPESGLFDLRWSVVVDWARLQKLVAWGVEDTLTISLTLGGSLPTLTATWQVAIAGIDATIFDTPQKLADKQYDGNKTEQDYVNALIDALVAAGLRVRDGKIELPSVLENPEKKLPNWETLEDATDKIKAAVLAYKKANRVHNGMDCIAGQKEWVVNVPIQRQEVDANGNPVTNPDGTPKMKTINLKIFFNPQRDAKGNGGNAEGNDLDSKKKPVPCTLLIVIGQCGGPGSGANDPGHGGDAMAEVKGGGSVGIAVGGDGRDSTDPAVNRPGGNGGNARVEAGDPKRQPGTPGPTGVAIGGEGGDSEAPNTLPGNGGDAVGTGKRGGRGNVVARGGDSGKPKSPPAKPAYRSGDSSVDNPDSVPKTDGRTSAGSGVTETDSKRPGKCTGGAARAEAGKTPKSTPPDIKGGTPITGD